MGVVSTPGKSEICDLRLEVFVKEDVAAPDVAVDQVAGVEVAQAAGSSQSDGPSGLPVEGRGSVFTTQSKIKHWSYGKYFYLFFMTKMCVRNMC